MMRSASPPQMGMSSDSSSNASSSPSQPPSDSSDNSSSKHAPPAKLSGLAGKYASALWRVASKEQQIDRVTEELSSVRQMLSASSALQSLVYDPTIKRSSKLSGINDLISEVNASSITSHFLTVLVENGRLSHVEHVANQWDALLSAQRGELTATIRSAEPFDSEDIETLKTVLKSYVGSSQALNIQTVTDRSLLGGFVVNFGDQQLDMSLDSRVKKYESILSESL